MKDEDWGDDLEKLKRFRSVVRDVEERLTKEEEKYEEARKQCRDSKKKVDGIREELRRVNKFGPDPQTDLPFVTEGEAGIDGMDAGSAAAVASYNKKKAKAVAATKKETKKKAAKKKAALPF